MITQSKLIFDRLVSSGFEQKASDLFLFPGQMPFIRKDGEIKILAGESVVTVNFIDEILNFLLDPNQKEEFNKQWQITFSKELERGQRAKFNILKQREFSSILIKLIPDKIISLESLKLPKVINNLASLSHGLIIISGPKDSGRTTFLSAMVDFINRNFIKYIATIERPIEYLFVGGKSLVEQREVGRDVLSFEAGLKLIKNRPVDVLVVSEVENPKIFFELLEIAQMGVLVFTVMNVGSTFNLIKQIIESYEVEKQNLIRLLLGENLGGIICTRLVPRLGKGRILALEILNGSPVAKTLIKEGKIHQINNLLQITEKELSISLDRFLADLVLSGEIVIDEAVKHCIDKENLLSLIRR
ncbi:MAG: type IV pilus twitching motility protein PilT [Patescibacteria group bacterium]